MLDPQARRNRKTPGRAALRASTGSRSPASGVAASAAAAKSSEAAPSWRLGLLLHFFVHLALVADAEPPLARRGFGRTHHRILYFAHFAPGITVGELLDVLRLTHQSAQRALRQLHQEGYIEFRLSKEDRRLKLVHCTRQGDRLLEALSVHQRERVERAYEQSTPEELRNFFTVLERMIDAEDRSWTERLLATKE